MHHTTQLLALVSIASVTGSWASPLQSRATATNCTDVTTGLDPSCWAKLNMTSWFDQWATKSDAVPMAHIDSLNRRSHQPSSSASTTTAQCETNESWSTCFLRLGLGHTGQNCTTVQLGGPNDPCTAPVAGKPPHTAQIFYGMWNIYAINQYISNLFLALTNLNKDQNSAYQSAASTAPGNIPYFTSATPANQAFSIDVPLLTLLFKTTNNRQLPTAPNTPLAEYLESNPSTETYNIDSNISLLAIDVQDRLAAVLNVVMTDFPTFLKSAGGGAFSTTMLPSADALLKAMEA